MSSYLLKQYNGGQSDFEDRGVAGSFKIGESLNIRKEEDTLSCQQALITLGSGTIVDLIRWLVPSTDGNCYGFGSLGKIYKITSAGVVSVVYTDADGAITGAKEFYQQNDKTYLFWTTATKLHSKELPGNGAWSDVDADIVVGSTHYTYPKSNLTSATWHTMTDALGELMIANKSLLAQLGYDGSYTTEVLNVFKNNYIKTVIERGTAVIVGAPSNDNSPQNTLFAWYGLSNSWDDKKSLKGGVINAMIDTDMPLCQVGTNGGIAYSDMNNVLPITSIRGGGYCNPGGVTNDDGLALFGIYGNSANRNGIYGYGKKVLNLPVALNMEYSVGACDEIGAIAKVSTDIMVSYKIGSNYYLAKVDTAAKATAYYYSLDLKPPKRLNYVPTWNHITLNTKALPSGCKIEVYFKKNKTGDFIQAKMEGNITQFNTVDGTEAIFLLGHQAKIGEVKIKLTPSANTTPEIESIEIFFT